MNTMDDLFIVATRNKYRFPYNGQISVEDLWDLKQGQLDQIYKTLMKSKTTASGESLMTTRTAEDATLEAKIEIVKFIFETKEAEKREAILKQEKEAQKNRVRQIIAEKKDKALADMSIEDLQKLLDD